MKGLSSHDINRYMHWKFFGARVALLYVIGMIVALIAWYLIPFIISEAIGMYGWAFGIHHHFRGFAGRTKYGSKMFLRAPSWYTSYAPKVAIVLSTTFILIDATAVAAWRLLRRLSYV